MNWTVRYTVYGSDVSMASPWTVPGFEWLHKKYPMSSQPDVYIYVI